MATCVYVSRVSRPAAGRYSHILPRLLSPDGQHVPRLEQPAADVGGPLGHAAVDHLTFTGAGEHTGDVTVSCCTVNTEHRSPDLYRSWRHR